MDTSWTVYTRMSASSDRCPVAELIRRLQAGDSSALEPFIEQTQQAAYKLALSYLRDPQLSQDALQEAYLLVYRKVDQLRQPQAYRSWFFRLVSNCCLDLLRKHVRKVLLRPSLKWLLLPSTRSRS